MAEPSPKRSKFADDGFSRNLANIVEERANRIRRFVEQDKACSRDELSKFIWGTAKAVRKQIMPEQDPKRLKAWTDAKGLLKELIDFGQFTPSLYQDSCVKNVLEKKVLEILEQYRTYVLTGEIHTKHPPPKLLGETDEILCVDKPSGFICSYGGGNDSNKFAVPELQGATSATVLLNMDKAEIQIHEYLSLKYNYETAVGTREWWSQKPEYMTCNCGECGYCACTQGGCCNRLDRETSGVMVAAKTKAGYGEIRRQFKSEHSVESGGTEKYYLALVHGKIEVPLEATDRGENWKHGPLDNRGRIEVPMGWDGRKSVAWSPELTNAGSRQHAVTFYEPVAWLSHPEYKDPYTLLFIQIITGRRHQIRFHCAEVGVPLVGDGAYGAPHKDREWCNRVFLHSYKTCFREPFTNKWFQAISPLPPDLGAILETLKVDRVQEALSTPGVMLPLVSRRRLDKSKAFFKQYEPTVSPLLYTLDVDLPKAPKANPEPVLPPERSGPWGPRGGAAVRAGNSNEAAANGDKGWGDSSWTGHDGSWNSSDWNSSEWNSDWKSGWGNNGWNSSSWSGQEASKPAAAQAAQDDDDAWGDWAPPKEPEKETAPAVQAAVAYSAPAMQPEESLAKRRTEMTAEAPVRGPTTPGQPPQGGWRRMQSRSATGVFYYFNSVTGETLVEPPPPWEKRESRSAPGIFYYFNPLTGVTSAVKPEV
mmetsp:Transcript_70776/g.153696  ORF Transcript_70776/g.153696 Transcript_70776/m.153696 type:complete len:705 (+) Transcript_70776:127-2241(+)